MRANYQVNQTIQFKMLSDQQCEEIYLAALEVLERTGADVHSPEWKAAGAKTMGQRVKEKTQKIINNHTVEPLPKDVVAQISKIIEKAEAREASKKAEK